MGDFPLGDDDIYLYKNTKKSHIFTIASKSVDMPYNDVKRWINDLDMKTRIVVDEEGDVIASLKLEDFA